MIEDKHAIPGVFLPPREEELKLDVDTVEERRSPDTLMVLSGGMDSVTMLHEYRSRIALAVTFSYGANHNSREAECARYHCRLLGIPLLEIPLGFMAEHFHSSLLQGAHAVPEGEYNEASMKSTVVPFRNGIMLAVATGLAETRGLGTVMMANHAGDHAIYPDCRPEFVAAMGAAMATGTYCNVHLLCPYTHLTKGEIAMRGVSLGVDYRHTYSCYRGGERHCGTCSTCRERAEALSLAGLDPAEYM